MPILWRYLLTRYSALFLLSLASILFLLFALRLEEITHFISQDAPAGALLSFIGHQIPFLLPIAIPLSALIAAYLVARALSEEEEMTAFRAQGMGFCSIAFPLLIGGALLGTLNFYLTSEVATLSHLKTSLLKNELKKINPLLLLHNKRILQNKGIIFDHMGSSQIGKWADGVIIATLGDPGESPRLFLADRLAKEKEGLVAYKAALFYENSEKLSLLENVEKLLLNPENVAPLLQRSTFTESDDQLPWHRLSEKFQKLEAKESTPLLSEMVRRLTLGMAPLLFTLAGFSFGGVVGRKESIGSLILLVCLICFYLVTFFIAKGLSDKKEATLLLYSLPSLLITCASILRLFLLSRGKNI